jgi:plasmid stabilization system protein ParE
MNVVVTDEAFADLASIQDYIAQQNPRRAITFIGELLDRCGGLADLALAFPLLPRYEDRGIRRRPHRGYSIFYRIAGNDVIVIHILHGARDFESLLFPDGD